nr:hypothetical protein GCM10010200_048860 [Actinomadura rugatobispora]
MTRLLGAVADSGPVLILAGIAAAGSFTHIRDTATEHGQGGWMAWAIAVCIDLTCVMAARERQRDKRTDRHTGRLSWPTVVLVGGILLSLAANLAQADPSPWGWITAATPAGAFLVAVSMLERRTTGATGQGDEQSHSTAAAVMTAPPSFGRPDPSPAPLPQDENRPELAADVSARPGEEGDQDGQTTIPVPTDEGDTSSSSSPAPLVDFARRVRRRTPHRARAPDHP